MHPRKLPSHRVLENLAKTLETEAPYSTYCSPAVLHADSGRLSKHAGKLRPQGSIVAMDVTAARLTALLNTLLLQSLWLLPPVPLRH